MVTTASASCSKLRKNQCLSNTKCHWNGKKCQAQMGKTWMTQPNQQPIYDPYPKEECPKTKCPYGKLHTPDEKQCVELEYIDSGEYGCIVKPPIVNKEYIIKDYIPYVNRDNTDIAKLNRKDKHFNQELKYLDMMGKIDPERKFTIEVKGAQEFIGRCLINNKTIINCLRKGNYIENRSFYQIILEFGGVKVNAKNTYELSYVQFLKCCKQFVAGMIKMQESNIVHRDVKPGNVLYKASQNKLNLIDFGLMCPHYSELYDGNNKSSMYILEFKEYATYPPEFFVAYIMLSYRHYYEGNKAKFDSFVENDLMRKLQNYGFFNTDHLVSNPLLQREYEIGIQSFIETIKALDVTRCAEIFTRDIAMKADVFAFAYIIASLQRNIPDLNEDEEEFIDILYRRCIRANPYDRATFMEIFSLLSSEYSRSLSSQKRGSTSHGGNRLFQNVRNKIKAKMQPYLKLTVDKIKNILDKNHPSPRMDSRPSRPSRPSGPSRSQRTPVSESMSLTQTKLSRLPSTRIPSSASSRPSLSKAYIRKYKPLSAVPLSPISASKSQSKSKSKSKSKSNKKPSPKQKKTKPKSR
jgi:serine/threonine protein kinase